MPQPPGAYEQGWGERDGFDRPQSGAGPRGAGAFGAGIVAEDETAPPPLPRAKRPFGVRLVSAVVGLLLIGGAFAVRSSVPDEYEQRYAPLLEQGKAGEQVSTSRFSFKVDAVHSARVIGWQVFTGGDREKAATDGVFVIIAAQATTPKEPVTLRAANLVTADGTRFEPTDKAMFAEPLDEQLINAGFWTPGMIVFEVPKGADLTGAKLQVSDDRLMPSNFAAGADIQVPGYGVEVDLGLDAAEAQRLIRQPEAGRLLPKGTS